MAQVQQPIVPSRLYRYRSLTRSPNATQQEINSIVENYVFGSDFTRMNDPMEGFYRPSKLLQKQSNFEDIVRQLSDRKTGTGIACFSETHDNTLMWTHYASNYTGICLAYSTKKLLAGLPDSVRLVRLAYVDEPPLIYPSHANDADNAAFRILSQKKSNWAYEREWRVLGSIGRVDISSSQALKGIYFGSRSRSYSSQTDPRSN